MARTTMLDLTKRRHGAKEVGLIEANLSYAPELGLFPARTIEGTSYTTLLRVGLPTVAFTHLNGGVAASKSRYENKLVEAFIIRSLIEIDKAAISADTSASSLQTDESMGVTEATLRLIGRQVYYGRTAGKGDAKGFPGLQDMVDNTMVYNATGTTADTASSIYLIKFGIKDVQMIFGKNQTLALPPFRDETLTDSEGNKYDGQVSHLTGWVGLQCTNPNSLVRVCNVTEDSGKGCTDVLLAKALDKFPTGIRPDVILMSKRSRTQLQTDRAARTSNSSGKTNGGSVYAPTPTDYEGISIVATDSILNTEAIVS